MIVTSEIAPRSPTSRHAGPRPFVLPVAAILLISHTLLVAGCGANQATTRADPASCPVSPTAPVAKRADHVTEIHGMQLQDPYYWLREKENPEVRAHLEAENAYTAAMTAHSAQLRDGLYSELLSHIKESDETAPYPHGDYLYYSRTEEGKNYRIYCRRKADPADSPEQVILDENQLAEGLDYYATGVLEVSPDHELLAYSVDTTGAEKYRLVIKNLADGTVQDPGIDGTYYSVVWANDSKTLFYNTVDAANRPFRVYRHALGTPATDDVLVYEEQDEKFFASLHRARSDAFLFIGLQSAVTTEYHFVSADQPMQPFRLITPRRQNIEYHPEHHADSFFIVSNDEATNFRLFQAPIETPSREHWNEIIPHSEEVTLRSVDAFENHLVVWARRDGLPHVIVRDLRTAQTHHVQFPEQTYAAWPGDNYEYATNRLRFVYTSLATPRSVFDYDMDQRTLDLRKELEVPEFDRSLYDSARIEATAADGVKVPISLVWRRGSRDKGPTPLFLTAYGSYGASFDPYFSSNRLSLLDRGVVFAIAHVRGGGEKGRGWYETGKYLQKKNTFTDFIASAEHLVAEGWTTPDRLAISGSSAGGLLVGAVLNMRPDLFAAAVAGVPFVDVLNTMLDPSIPLTVIEWEEWGNPNDRKYFDYMRSYSPYDNVAEAQYPDLLVTAGFNDPRVAYWEPAKWVARLRQRAEPGSTLLLKTNMGAGHGGSSGRYDYLKDVAFEYAFVLESIGVESFPARESSCP